MSGDEVTDEQGMQNEPKTMHAFKNTSQTNATPQSKNNNTFTNDGPYTGIEYYHEFKTRENLFDGPGNSANKTAKSFKLLKLPSNKNIYSQKKTRIGTETTNLNNSVQTQGSKTGTQKNHYQLQGIQRSMNRIDKFLRPASVLSNGYERKSNKSSGAQSLKNK